MIDFKLKEAKSTVLHTDMLALNIESEMHMNTEKIN